jgi:hypothetical protein
LDPDKVLLALAGDSLEAAVDALWVISAENIDPRLAADLADLGATVAQYVVSNGRPPWIKSARNDQDFPSELFREATTGSTQGTSLAHEHFGMDEVKNVVRGAAGRLREGVVRLLELASENWTER